MCAVIWYIYGSSICFCIVGNEWRINYVIIFHFLECVNSSSADICIVLAENRIVPYIICCINKRNCSTVFGSSIIYELCIDEIISSCSIIHIYCSAISFGLIVYECGVIESNVYQIWIDTYASSVYGKCRIVNEFCVVIYVWTWRSAIINYTPIIGSFIVNEWNFIEFIEIWSSIMIYYTTIIFGSVVNKWTIFKGVVVKSSFIIYCSTLRSSRVIGKYTSLKWVVVRSAISVYCSTIGSGVVNKFNINIWIIVVYILISIYCSAAVSSMVFKKCNVFKCCFG